MTKLAVIRIRGKMKVRHDKKKAMEVLKLDRQQTLAITPNKPEFLGMVRMVNDFVMWGEVPDGIIKTLEDKGVEFSGENQIKWAHLQPPRGGYKSIKKQQPHGSLGKHDNMVEWIDKMIHGE